MDFNKFFTYHKCDIDVLSDRTDKVGVITLIATKKNIFYEEGEKVEIGIYENHQHGRMCSYPPVRVFIDYFDMKSDFLDFLFDLWEKNKLTAFRYEQTDIKKV
jgi:hypothetical protein